MNAVEIEAALSDLSVEPFDAQEFPYQFLAAFGNKEVALKRLRTGNNNASDLPNGVLLRNNIHLATCEVGKVPETLQALRLSPSNAKAKAKFILATDGETIEAEELITGETVTSAYTDFPNHFGMFLPLAGISTIKEIKDNPIDVRATGRLNKLYVELLRENPEWAKAERRGDMNHFMSRLIFCFFAEDTGIFNSTGLFSKTVEQMSERDGSNAHEVLEAVFRAMNIKTKDRANAQPKLPNWAGVFPYVNGGLFSGSTEVPRFSRIARTYLSHAANLNWKEINPDIFGSMIQAVADDEERGALGMHYTSVPNILKVLNPLFLDDLRTQLEVCGDNKAKLLNLRKRMARIRVFDPACGSGNFLVIAYKQMREIEAEINRRRGEELLGSEIPLTNFRGIELRDFPAEIARLALIIAEFQCDVLYRGQQDALAEFLPLDAENWIVCDNSLVVDWSKIFPKNGTTVKKVREDLFDLEVNSKEIEFENDGGETYICGNPPFAGQKNKNDSQRQDMDLVMPRYISKYGELDYVTAFYMKAADYVSIHGGVAALVSTNSIVQGRHIPILWPAIFKLGCEIVFGHRSFLWKNNAAKNASVYCVVVGIGKDFTGKRFIYDENSRKEVKSINAYLTEGSSVTVTKKDTPISPDLQVMRSGNMPLDNGFLLLSCDDREILLQEDPSAILYVKKILGAKEINQGLERYCLWIEDGEVQDASKITFIRNRIDACRVFRKTSSAPGLAETPHAFRDRHRETSHSIVLPNLSSEHRNYRIPILTKKGVVASNLALAIYDGEIFQIAVLASRLHHVWVEAVCGKFKQDFRYSNDMGWHTFPLPQLTEMQKTDLRKSAEELLLAQEKYFPNSLNKIYNDTNGENPMPEDLQLVHQRNDELIERIYIGRRFKNDTERLGKLFELYEKMTANSTGIKKGKK
ncbi:DNA methyltransferase [Limnohabitans sp. Bal53]|uniref:class I SAM-dependent DNA methyltransferase n=1 Tax=Limnohabitans sp. Bal53 TaxID=1977910 RepID=UPI000D3AD21A|nr:DNA methyltransferase [Limnohabitans sp. Bal53]PUE40181.1 lactate dehydrogenase [Limnohabitans sp. Bal53]